MGTLKRFVTFISLFCIYIIIRELLQLYVLSRSVHPLLGYGVLILLAAGICYFIVLPVIRILRIPKNFAPTTDPEKAQEIIHSRLLKFRSNPYLLAKEFDFNALAGTEEDYNRIVDELRKEAEVVRRKYVLQLFYSSSISQNGFLDAILILSSSINLVKELFFLYHGRVSNKDLLAIARRVYLSMAIGGSEGVEYATQELFSKFATDGFKSVPFADKIFGSLADGFVNAALLTRISLITENYCSKVLIASDRDLFPSAEFIIKTTKFITADIMDKMIFELLRMSRDKTVDYVMLAVNPVGHLFSRTFGVVRDGTSKIAAYPLDMLKDAATVANKPFIYGIDRLAAIFRKSKLSF